MPIQLPPIDIFSPGALQQIITDHLPPMPDDGKHNAAVLSLDAQGATIAAQFKFHEGSWTGEVNAAAQHTWSGTNGVGANVLIRW